MVIVRTTARSRRRRRRPRGGDGQGHQHPSDQRLLLGGTAGVRHRRPGREGADRHERHPPGGQGLSSPARRARPRTSSSACAAAAWRWSAWCSTRWPAAAVLTDDDERELGVAWWTSAPAPPTWAIFTGGACATPRDPDRRRPDHQRHRDGAAHAHQGRRGHQGRTAVTPSAAGRPEAGRGAGPGRPGAAHAQPPGAGGCDRPRVGNLSLVQQVIRESGYEEAAVLRHGAHRRQRRCRHGGTGRDIFLKPVRRGIPKYSWRAGRHGGPAARRRSWACSKRHAWPVPDTQGGAKGPAPSVGLRPTRGFPSWGTSDHGTCKGPGQPNEPMCAGNGECWAATARSNLTVSRQQGFQSGELMKEEL